MSVKIDPGLRWSFIELTAFSNPLKGVEIKTKSALLTASFGSETILSVRFSFFIISQTDLLSSKVITVLAKLLFF